MKCTQAILSSIGQEGIIFETEIVKIAIRETKLEIERKEKRRREKANEWNSLIVKKHQQQVELKYKSHREPTLKFSNLLHEEELFLSRLNSLDKLNFRIDGKRGTKTVQVDMNIQFSSVKLGCRSQ